jgi:splicing factor 3B subunit 3
LKQLNTFHVGDVVTDLFCALKEANGNPMLFLLYTTIRGAIGVISPLTSDAQFIQLHHLQTIIRGSCAPTIGVEHHLFRSRYYSTSTLIDADFIGQFKTLPPRERQLVHDKVMRELKVTNDMFEKRGMKRREFAESCDDMLLDIQALLSALLGVPQPVS